MKKLLASAGIGAALIAGSASAQTDTSNMNISATVTATCAIEAANALNFGEVGNTSANVDATTTIDLKCNDGAAFNIAIGAGGSTGATTTTRAMDEDGAGTDTLTYHLFTDAERSTNWGDSAGVDTRSGTGTGTTESIDVFGRVPVQAAPAAGTYSDTVVVTVNF